MASTYLAFFVNFWLVEICPKKSVQNPPKPQNNRAKLPQGHKPCLTGPLGSKKTFSMVRKKFWGIWGTRCQNHVF